MADAEPTPPLSDAERAARSSSFGGVADLYERYRPGPPAGVADWFLPVPVEGVVDLGAGTGALTRLLVERARDVVAVEPDDRMRAVLAAEVPEARAVAGRGEAIPVPDGSAQGVFASSSWHWMDPVPTLTEIHRVLVPGGVFGAVWTGPDPDGPFMQQAQALVTEVGDRDDERARLAGSLAAGGAAGARSADRLELPPGVPFGPVEEQTFVWDIALNADELIGLLGTLSWVILMPEDERTSMFATARRLLAELLGIEGETTVDVAYRAVAFRTFRND
jgi:SAM-dependent methyltransferase